VREARLLQEAGLLDLLVCKGRPGKAVLLDLLPCRVNNIPREGEAPAEQAFPARQEPRPPGECYPDLNQAGVSGSGGNGNTPGQPRKTVKQGCSRGEGARPPAGRGPSPPAGRRAYLCARGLLEVEKDGTGRSCPLGTGRRFPGLLGRSRKAFGDGGGPFRPLTIRLAVEIQLGVVTPAADLDAVLGEVHLVGIVQNPPLEDGFAWSRGSSNGGN